MRSGTWRPPHRKPLQAPLQLSVDYPFVPVPTAFFNVLPSLSGSEAKVLLCVLRQTAGWRTRSGERKTSDWISQSQFKAKTGLASAAISRAIDVLVRQGLLVAEDGSGNLLSTAADRRRLRGRVFFGVPPGPLPAGVVGTGASETGIRKTNRTKESSPTKELSHPPMGRGREKSATPRAPSPRLPGNDCSGMPGESTVTEDPPTKEQEERLLRAAKDRCRRTLREIRKD
ncbi:MAG: replication protein [Armatimonadota bacterium]